MVDITLLEEIFAKRSEGQELTLEEDELLDNLKHLGSFSGEDNIIPQPEMQTQSEEIEAFSDEAIDSKSNPLRGIALVCTKAKDGIPMLYEFKDVHLARIIANKIMRENL
jgi:hypothetical protein